MRFRCLCTMLMLAALALIVGCDKPPPPPPDAPPPPPKKDLPPTTQQILDGPRKTVSLSVMPFTVDVPAGWSVQSHGDSGSLTMLEGPMIGGDAHVILRARENVTPQRMKTLIDHVRGDAPAIEQAGGKLSIRDLGDCPIIERREAPRHPTTAPLPGAIERPIEWRITLFVPVGVNYEQYEMQFIDLSPDALPANQKLLENIVASLKYVDPGRPPM